MSEAERIQLARLNAICDARALDRARGGAVSKTVSPSSRNGRARSNARRPSFARAVASRHSAALPPTPPTVGRRESTDRLPPLREADFGRQVEALLDAGGWRWFHSPDARRCQCGRVVRDSRRRGFPDYVAVRGARLLFIELKSERGRVRPEQMLWVNRLKTIEYANESRSSHIHVYLWRPSDAAEIAAVLAPSGESAVRKPSETRSHEEKETP